MPGSAVGPGGKAVRARPAILGDRPQLPKGRVLETQVLLKEGAHSHWALGVQVQHRSMHTYRTETGSPWRGKTPGRLQNELSLARRASDGQGSFSSALTQAWNALLARKSTLRSCAGFLLCTHSIPAADPRWGLGTSFWCPLLPDTVPSFT